MRAGADLLGIGEQHVRALGHGVGEQLQLALAQHRDERLHALARDAVGELGEHLGELGVRRVRLGQLGGAGLHVGGE